MPSPGLAFCQQPITTKAWAQIGRESETFFQRNNLVLYTPSRQYFLIRYLSLSDLSHVALSVTSFPAVLMQGDRAIQASRSFQQAPLRRASTTWHLLPCRPHRDSALCTAVVLCRHIPEPATQLHPSSLLSSPCQFSSSFCACMVLSRVHSRGQNKEALPHLSIPLLQPHPEVLRACYCQQSSVGSTASWLSVFEKGTLFFSSSRFLQHSEFLEL